MARKKRKINKHYTITVTSDYSGKKTKVYRSKFNFIRVGTVCSLLVLIMAVGLTYILYKELSTVEDKVGVFKNLINEQESTINTLGTENGELKSEVDILRSMLLSAENEALAKEEAEAEKHLPSLFPISGSVLIATQEEVSKKYISEMEAEEEANIAENTDAYWGNILGLTKTDYDKVLESIAEEYQNIWVFKSNQSSDMVASAAGTVVGIGEDSLYGAFVLIDHGNGYETVYRNDGDLKVSVGDEVVRGTILFVNFEEESYFGFQIVEEGNYINPIEMIETEG